MADGFRNRVFRSGQLPSSRDLGREAADVSWVAADGTPRRIPMLAVDLARRYLDVAVEDHAVYRSLVELRSTARGAFAGGGPGFVVVQEAPSPLDGGTGTMVRFAQVYNGLRVYGARATVFLDSNQELVHLDVDAADTGDLEATPTDVDGHLIDPAGNRIDWYDSFWDVVDAVNEPVIPPVIWDWPYGWYDGTRHHHLGRFDLFDVPVEPLFFRPSDGERFLLCWLFRSAGPPTSEPEADRGGPTQDEPDREALREGRHRWFIDAAERTVVEVLPEERYGAVLCSGNDEYGTNRRFDGYRESDGTVSMRHHMRPLITFDLKYADHAATRADPAGMVQNANETWGDKHPAAVSAYVHATQVHSFLVGLAWQGSGAYGYEFDIVVNWAPPTAGGNDWRFAKFVEAQVIFGQERDANGDLVSLAQHRHLVAHEMVHAVTKSLANLNGTDEPGALDESISDTFGVAIDHLVANNDDASTWSWELGPALGAGGGPIRDMSNPGRGDPKQPAHVNAYVDMTADHGGVHINSGIHNLAMQRLLTKTDGAGAPVFQPQELLSQMLSVMPQLTNNAGFSDMRKKLVSMVASYYTDGTGPARTKAIEDAYQSVGII